jgi:hypothetical protein
MQARMEVPAARGSCGGSCEGRAPVVAPRAASRSISHRLEATSPDSTTQRCVMLRSTGAGCRRVRSGGGGDGRPTPTLSKSSAQLSNED